MAKQDPLRLRAQDADGLTTVSSFLQDALILPKDIQFDKAARRFAIAANRFRWETQRGLFKPRPTRVKTFLRFDFVDSVHTRSFDPEDTIPLNLLSIAAAADTEVRLTFSNGPEIALICEAIDVTLDDVGPPWLANRAPRHSA
ncbi:MAG: DUF2948 family protein [Pseudomonadota bacterium]